MLKAPSFNKKKNTSNETFFQEGMNLIRGSLYKQATRVLIQALQEDLKSIPAQLFKEFSNRLNASQFEAAVAIGEALREVSGQNAVFLVSIGNCYRRLLDFQKANGLYREALRVDKSHKLALYNLGASLAKVEIYDLDIKKTLDQFDEIGEHILPPYLNDPDILEKITDMLDKERMQRSELVESLQTEKAKLLKSGDTEAVKEVVKKIEIEERHLALSYYQAICKKLRKAIKTNWARQSIEKSKSNLQENLFNLGLYALSQRDLVLASESFSKLEAENSKIENLNLLLAIILELKGYTNQAIEKLIVMLKQNPNHRYASVNLGLMYKRRGNILLSVRYLLMAADLLEKSGGLYNIREIKVRASEYFEDEKLSEALALYEIIVKESSSSFAWNRIGEIRLQQEEFVTATMAFNEVLDIDPKNTKAGQKLMQIHDIYTLKGDTQFRNGFDRDAITLYQNALEIHESVEVMKKAIKAYERRNDFARVNFLKSEIKRLKKSQNEEKLEQKRLTLIEQGKQLMKQKKFDKAIEQLENAFEIKPDKDTFLLLAHIFKALKQGRKLSNLVENWKQLMESKYKTEELKE